MSSPNPVPQHTVRLASNLATRATPAVLQQARVTTAANDEAATADLGFGQNPLWVMAIALGVFCAVAAVVIGIG